MKQKISYIYNSFFFRKNFFIYDSQIFNKLFFYNYPNFWASPVVYALGSNFFFNEYLSLKISNYTFSFLKNLEFFKPFGFVDFLQKIFNFTYHLKYRTEVSLFLVDDQKVVKKSIILNKKFNSFKIF